MHSDKKLDTHCQKIRHLRLYVIFYLIENELNKTLARYLNALLRIKENNMNKIKHRNEGSLCIKPYGIL